MDKTAAPRVLLLYMSLWKNRRQPQTNERVCKDWARKSKQPGTIIALCSDAVRKERVDGCTTLEHFRTFLGELLPGVQPQEVLRIIEVPDTMEDADRFRAIQEVARALDNGAELTIDLTGGMRDTAALLVAMARYLKNFKQLASCRVLYADLNKNGCSDVTMLYDIIDLISATDRFLETGSAESLAAFFEHRHLENNAKKLMKAVREFSDNIALCRFDHLKSTAGDINDFLGKWTKNQSSRPAPTTLEPILFAYLAERFQAEFQGFTDLDQSLPEIFLWCHRHGLYQQALTLITEYLPACICRHTRLQPTQELRDDVCRISERANRQPDLAQPWCHYLFHAYLPRKINRERAEVDCGQCQAFFAEQRPAAVAFAEGDLPVLSEATACYINILNLRNSVNHANKEGTPCIDPTPDNVKKHLERCKTMLQTLSSRPVPPERPEGWLDANAPLDAITG